ncbi:LOW QUALITY PROTEIN: von Willebrand factor A domain-containing protein 7-like [Cynoglossus semilaevis]|uniref:LOW QUALITY PROTEIN: von Willebrand factor A domain-containing protein 7-like n=1 Tax=Cynoglossus semilaevis TaxID=244447 RepID=UPI000D624055|nr:LOW QUALITY PROTEIN: von Willebrand factor A domain-containing protein 7-like [Cynoglossus semilaevis]
MTARMRVLLLMAVSLSTPRLTHCFMPLFVFNGNSSTHLHITQTAILMKTAEVCRDIAASEGRNFSLTITESLSPDSVQRACSSTSSSSSLISSFMFYTSITTIHLSNALVDGVLVMSGKHHFDDEMFKEGRNIISSGVAAVKTSVEKESFVTGRFILGQVCHTLQDFYSYSNWVELGKEVPHSALISPDQPLENLAGPTVPTCRNCTGQNCSDNLLQQGLLTSGYFSILSSAKPPGKCSHGGFWDRTSRNDPVGGINKDKVESSHGSLHHKAADLAVNATVELLEDIRLAVGDKNFLRLMGLSQSPALCFVIGTADSMKDDIAAAKKVSFDIIDSKRGTEDEPSAYILVPFNDTEFGPLLMTTDADVFKDRINKLYANGNGDTQDLCLSGLQLALTTAPPYSDIFVFTDTPAKDAHLKNNILALIESSKSAVSVLFGHQC